MSDERNPLDSALDLLVFAPVGLAIKAAEEVPDLAAKGRAELMSRLATARVVGQFAVTRGRREIERRMAARTPVVPPGDGREPDDAYGDVGEREAGQGAAGDAPRVAGQAAPVPTVSALAIPGYDSLSASQVVQRLAGLTTDELVAVGAYEASHRGRRTILNRVEQLQGR